MGSANSTNAPSARDRIEEMRRAERARERRRRITVVVASTAVVAALIGAGAWAVSRSGDEEPAVAADAKSAAGSGRFGYDKDGVGTWSGKLARNHVTKKVAYPMLPPVGGDHNQVWMNCDGDVYADAIPNENAVHALEHGAVWVTYNGKASGADVKALEKKVEATPYSLMSPVEDQKDPIMLSAWGHQRTVKSASDPALGAFFEKFVQGRQTPEPGAPCTGGLSG